MLGERRTADDKILLGGGSSYRCDEAIEDVLELP